MPTKPESHLSRRERQIMDIIYAWGRASVAQVRRLLQTFFDSSTEQALVALLKVSRDSPTPGEPEHLATPIINARKEGR